MSLFQSCDLQKTKSGPEYEKNGKVKMEIIRNLGNHLHNMRTLLNGEGEIVLSKEAKPVFQIDRYRPCSQCYSWIIEEDMQTIGGAVPKKTGGKFTAHAQ